MALRSKLDIESSSNNLRDARIVQEQAELADKALAEKKLEEMSASELKDLGITYNEKSDYKKSQEILNLALKKIEQEDLTKDEKCYVRSYCYYGLANCERELGNTKEAIVLFQKSTEELDAIKSFRFRLEVGGLGNLIYLVQRNLGITYLITEEFSEAAKAFQQAETVARITNQTGRIPAVVTYRGSATALAGDLAKGLEILAEARKLYPFEARENSLDWASHRYLTGRAMEAAKDYMGAFVEYSEGLRLRTQLIDVNKIGLVYYHSRVADPNAGLGRVCLRLGRKEDAQKYFTQALAGYQAQGTGLVATARAQEMSCALEALAPKPELASSAASAATSYSSTQTPFNLLSPRRSAPNVPATPSENTPKISPNLPNLTV